MKDPLTAAERDRRRQDTIFRHRLDFPGERRDPLPGRVRKQDTDWNAVNLRAPWLKATVLAVIAAATVVIALQVSAMADRVDRLEAEQRGLAVCDHSHPVTINGHDASPPTPTRGATGPRAWPNYTEFALPDHHHYVTVSSCT